MTILRYLLQQAVRVLNSMLGKRRTLRWTICVGAQTTLTFLGDFKMNLTNEQKTQQKAHFPELHLEDIYRKTFILSEKIKNQESDTNDRSQRGCVWN